MEIKEITTVVHDHSDICSLGYRYAEQSSLRVNEGFVTIPKTFP